MLSGAGSGAFVANSHPIISRLSAGVYLDVIDVEAGTLMNLDPALGSYLAAHGIDVTVMAPFDHVVVVYRDLSVLNAATGARRDAVLMHRTNSRLTDSLNRYIKAFEKSSEFSEEKFAQISRVTGQPVGLLDAEALDSQGLKYLQRKVSLAVFTVKHANYRKALANDEGDALKSHNDVEYYVGVRKLL